MSVVVRLLTTLADATSLTQDTTRNWANGTNNSTLRHQYLCSLHYNRESL